MPGLDNFGLISLAIESGDKGGFGGRTRLQKMTYFSKQIGWRSLRYRFHYYGPYSEDITWTLHMAINADMVKEERVERKACRYTLSDEGRDFFGICLDECDHDLVKRTRKLFSKLSCYTEKQLELAATVDYLRDNRPGSSREQIIEKISAIKDGTPEPIDEAYDIYLQIRQQIKELAPRTRRPPWLVRS